MISKKELKKLIGSDELFATVFKIVKNKKLSGKYYKPISIKINDIRTELLSCFNYELCDIDTMVAMELYKLVKVAKVKDRETGEVSLVTDKFDKYCGKYENFITMVLHNIVVNTSTRDKLTSSIFVLDGEMFGDVNKPEKLSIEHIEAIKPQRDSGIIELARSVYGDVVVEMIIAGYTLKEIASVLCVGYTDFLKSIYNSEDVFRSKLNDCGYKVSKKLDTKKCSCCGIEKKLSEFYKDNRNKLGVTTKCRVCINKK